MPSATMPGAVPTATGTLFRVWALGRDTVSVVLENGDEFALQPDGKGYFSAELAGIGAGDRYQIRIDDQPTLLPDPASRWQPEGPGGPSVICDPTLFDWSDQHWAGVRPENQVLYELHIGTFTAAGTWEAAAEKLPTLRELGITVLQVMPIGAYNGRFGWGYDTVLHYAPTHHYGTPDDLRRFIDRAHALGLGVLLDVVYNHVGFGDHFADFSPHYFTTSHINEWGASFNFDAEGATGARDFVVSNAVYWIREFHFDGLRLDATQALIDDSDEHIIAAIARQVRAAVPNRAVYLVAENQPQDRHLITATGEGGYGLDALGNDDFHHAARVALTGHNDFYYRDYLGTPQELLSAAKYGFLYQGQRSDMRNLAYGTYNLDTPSFHIVNFLENHDQIANSARGFRLNVLGSPARVRALTALLLLAPQTPCLFHGQEFGATGPFYYFAGFEGEEAEAVGEGRAASLSHFAGVEDPAMRERLADPADPTTFAASKLDWAEFTRNEHIVALHRDLLALRRSEAAFSQTTSRHIDGAVLADAAFLIRYITENPADHRLLLVNLGRDHPVGVAAEPLLAPPPGQQWAVQWSSEDPVYAGTGRRATAPDRFWILPGDSALLFSSIPLSDRTTA